MTTPTQVNTMQPTMSAAPTDLLKTVNAAMDEATHKTIVSINVTVHRHAPIVTLPIARCVWSLPKWDIEIAAYGRPRSACCSVIR